MGVSEDSVVLQGFEQHRVFDVTKHPADVVGVRRTCEVRVKRFSLPTFVPGDGLLLVHLANVLFGIFGVSSFTCNEGGSRVRVLVKIFLCCGCENKSERSSELCI